MLRKADGRQLRGSRADGRAGVRQYSAAYQNKRGKQKGRSRSGKLFHVLHCCVPPFVITLYKRISVCSRRTVRRKDVGNSYYKSVTLYHKDYKNATPIRSHVQRNLYYLYTTSKTQNVSRCEML